jgi:hypothetical protein
VHKRAVRQWIGQLATTAGAVEPAALARALTVLLDGGLAAGALEPAPDIAAEARRAARTLVNTACHDNALTSAQQPLHSQPEPFSAHPRSTP